MQTISPTMSNSRFWAYTLGLLIVWGVVIASANPSTAVHNNRIKAATFMMAPFNDIKREARNTRNCKTLCGHCGCRGFYCGEECICECNKEGGDTECIVTMQRNARKLSIPFQLMIQGPRHNRFVRIAQYFDKNGAVEVAEVIPNTSVIRRKRANVVIYKPITALTPNQLFDRKERHSTRKEAIFGVRHKRSVPQLDWFNDFASNLVRPAPLSNRKKIQETTQLAEAPAKPEKRSSDKPDRSWFADNSNMLLKPAPLYSRQIANNNEEKLSEDYIEETNKLSRLLKDTIRSFQGNDLRNDIGESLKPNHKLSHHRLLSDNFRKFDLIPKPTLENEVGLTFHPKNTMRQGFQVPRLERPIEYKSEKPPVKLPLPWFRPVRFLHRVRQAIN